MHAEIKPGLMENEGLTCFQALKRVVGEITPTLGWGRRNRNFLA